MYQFVEPRVRRVVADQLGVGADELTPEVSLIDDLAADSLDLLEVALDLEAHFGIQLPESALEEVRTYGDLLALVRSLVRRRELAEEPEPLPLVWARVLPAPGRGAAEIQHSGWLTAYTADQIAEDARRAGRGAQLDVSVPSTVSDARLTELQEEFAWLREHGVAVSVRRQPRSAPATQGIRPHAA